MKPFTLTIFGATGDLTHRKLLPALYALFRLDQLPADFAVVGFARRPYTDASYREWIAESLRAFSRLDTPPDALARFLDHVCYHAADVEAGAEAFADFRRRLDADPARFPASRLYYLSVKPDLFPVIVDRLASAGLIGPAGRSDWTRVVIEKPFGTDLASARALNRHCKERLHERQIFRIDHYLGKETVQNMLSFRFANAIFEPLFNSHYVHHVQITAAETVGMESGRGAYYDQAGALRDMVQNHLLQLFAFMAMEPPAGLTADAVRNEKVKALEAVRRTAPGCVNGAAAFGQYGPGRVDGRDVPGFTAEERVRPDSRTPTFAALRLDVDNWRWSGVPFYLRTGKRLARRLTEIVVQFKVPPLRLFETLECEGDQCRLTGARPNRLIFRIQPREGIALRFSAKRPATLNQVEDVKMEFTYADTWRKNLPEAYERLLLDVLRGDATLFTRADEVEAAWRIVNPFLRAGSDPDTPVYPYAAGAWGPPQADAVLRDTDTLWHNPEPAGVVP